ncbi:MAG: hypothetical protein ACK4Q5_10530 [Saprospiraceae bacterium]
MVANAADSQRSKPTHGGTASMLTFKLRINNPSASIFRSIRQANSLRPLRLSRLPSARAGFESRQAHKQKPRALKMGTGLFVFLLKNCRPCNS